jgi:hypothetical protein
MKSKKKKKEDFKEFRNNEKSAYKTFKILLKTILLNRDTTQPVIDHLVFEMNDFILINLFGYMCCINTQIIIRCLNWMIHSFCIVSKH